MKAGGRELLGLGADDALSPVLRYVGREMRYGEKDTENQLHAQEDNLGLADQRGTKKRTGSKD